MEVTTGRIDVDILVIDTLYSIAKRMLVSF